MTHRKEQNGETRAADAEGGRSSVEWEVGKVGVLRDVKVYNDKGEREGGETEDLE